MSIFQTVDLLVEKGLKAGLITEEDEVYARNRVLALLDLEDYRAEGTSEGDNLQIPDLLEALTEYAVEEGIVDDLFDKKEIFSAEVMNSFIARPSVINAEFFSRYQRNPEEATDYFYQLSQDSNYIQTKRIKQNISYKAPTEYGELDITINLSKPEKDPKQIAMERAMPKKDEKYPQCLLCVENEGYAGRIGHPARANHRMIRLNLGDRDYMLQYSPYVYYNEHSIILSKEHRPMEINKDGFRRLLQFVHQFPHYFAGSNADLPIVGGSILSHDHYQGGRYDFAMAKAESEYGFSLKRFRGVEASIVKWPMSVIRLSADEMDSLVEAADDILAQWKGYSDPEVDILAHSGDTPHNTITPIARMRDGRYELDLVLRNNRTNDEHPMGIFHPHADVHHIKKENIGLIEVMGLAVLPARLKAELQEVENALLGNENNVNDIHLPWVEDMKARHGSDINKENVTTIVRQELGHKFSRVLEDAGVFKRDDKGMEAFKKFVDGLDGE
ncbi:UDP-glucose--hexose-1-phosphate uridylyltransferase [Rossellomorea aquimaris]|uniref:UDP-glucose--hexose-1-phosphate uridylyltransferase n=1 Tax=Rossellomorea aquimaris TaxID=189382 RepID=UPI001CD54E16|nr:UDP-glucose--hexose-1-phosphate uridylyltransferase [Rossellomorea aquimaris]MCA1055255.1 UDP-glucose--hexose-1-phosphate uridylyltransferase [Rossellomorea aquimaris]